jgi:hypothetical protein
VRSEQRAAIGDQKLRYQRPAISAGAIPIFRVRKRLNRNVKRLQQAVKSEMLVV